MPIDDSSDPSLDQTLNCWPLQEHHCAETFVVSAWFNTDDPPVRNHLLSPSTRADALRGNRGLYFNCHEDNHSLKHNRLPLINASGYLHTELDQLGDDDAYQRWPEHTVCYRRDGKSPRPNNHKKNRRHSSGQSRGYHQDQGQVDCHNDTTNTCDYHIDSGIPLSPAFSASAPAAGMCFEPPMTRAEIRAHGSLVHSVPAIESLTAVQHTRPVRGRHCWGTSFGSKRWSCTCC